MAFNFYADPATNLGNANRLKRIVDSIDPDALLARTKAMIARVLARTGSMSVPAYREQLMHSEGGDPGDPEHRARAWVKPTKNYITVRKYKYPAKHCTGRGLRMRRW